MTKPEYGYTHRQARARAKIVVDHEGYVCPLCHAYRPPGSAFELDHHPDGVNYRGPACPACNAGDGGRKARRNDRLRRIRTRNW